MHYCKVCQLCVLWWDKNKTYRILILNKFFNFIIILSIIVISQNNTEAKVFKNELSGSYTKDILIYFPVENTIDNEDFNHWNTLDMKYMYRFSKYIYFGAGISYNITSYTKEFKNSNVVDSNYNINFFAFHFYAKQYFSNPNLLTGFVSFDFGISIGEVRHDQYLFTGSTDIGLNIPLNSNYKLSPSAGASFITNDYAVFVLNLQIELIYMF